MINTQAAGLFALDYAADGAAQRRSLFTQFEAPDARRFFPGWDEPNFRTPYDLAVVVPAGQQAISNMPEAGREARPDGSTVVRFQTTPAMSSYLLFLAVGEFDRITTTAGGTEIGVVTRRGAGEQGRWALESSARIVPWYNQYFGTPYPLPKLDNIAGPGSSQFFSAMENWGAIFSFENILLVDPAITTEARRQAIFSVAAHEIAHQWFGNLVTMSWWDDLWLNEGFASWMATNATQALHPEWEPLLDRVDGREHGDAARFARHHPSRRAAHPDRRADEPGVRRDHLPEGRGGDHHAGGLCRRRRLAARRAGLYRPAPAREHPVRGSVAGDRGGLGPAGPGAGARFHAAARASR